MQSKIRAVLLTFTELRKKITAITVSGQNQLLLGISKTITVSVVGSEKKICLIMYQILSEVKLVENKMLIVFEGYYKT